MGRSIIEMDRDSNRKAMIRTHEFFELHEMLGLQVHVQYAGLLGEQGNFELARCSESLLNPAPVTRNTVLVREVKGFGNLLLVEPKSLETKDGILDLD